MKDKEVRELFQLFADFVKTQVLINKVVRVRLDDFENKIAPPRSEVDKAQQYMLDRLSEIENAKDAEWLKDEHN